MAASLELPSSDEDDNEKITEIDQIDLGRGLLELFQIYFSLLFFLPSVSRSLT